MESVLYENIKKVGGERMRKERRKGLTDRRSDRAAQIKFLGDRLMVNGVEICIREGKFKRAWETFRWWKGNTWLLKGLRK